MDISWPEFKYS